MRYRPSLVYEILRNGERYRVFSSRQTAISYLAAALDLDPVSDWQLRDVCSLDVGESDD